MTVSSLVCTVVWVVKVTLLYIVVAGADTVMVPVVVVSYKLVDAAKGNAEEQ